MLGVLGEGQGHPVGCKYLNQCCASHLECLSREMPGQATVEGRGRRWGWACGTQWGAGGKESRKRGLLCGLSGAS